MEFHRCHLVLHVLGVSIPAAALGLGKKKRLIRKFLFKEVRHQSKHWALAFGVVQPGWQELSTALAVRPVAAPSSFVSSTSVKMLCVKMHFSMDNFGLAISTENC